ncbi:MAG TPA: DUF4251 domain-containing protein [Bacteroides sp.]|nr:DUF4251 domain-containing protein [Bacteroides sp.]
MKTLAIIFLACASVLGASAQDDMKLSKSELKMLQKEQKKAEQAALEEEMKGLVDAMITYQQFVLEADYLSDKYGTRIPVQSTINFIIADSLEGVLQFGSAMTNGYNGVGGSTINGRINNYKYQTIGKKKDSYSVSFSFNSSLGTYDITILVTSNGNADATVRGNWSGSLSYHGRLVPISLSRIYKGSAIN